MLVYSRECFVRKRMHILVCVWVWTVGNSLFRYIVTKAKKRWEPW